MIPLALALLLTASCGDAPRVVHHYAIGLAPGQYRIATCAGDTLEARAGIAGNFAFEVRGCLWPVRIWRVGE
jgi:hypothetical protein